MTSPHLAACPLLCALVCISAAAQNAEAHYPPFRAGSIRPLVQMRPATVPQVVPVTTATWTKGKNAPPVSVGTYSPTAASWYILSRIAAVASATTTTGTPSRTILGAMSTAAESRWLPFRVATIRCSLALPSLPMAKWLCKAGNTLAREAAITSF